MRKEEIGRGGYGKVYKIPRKSTGEMFALKEVPRSVLNNPGAARNIQRERLALRYFDSPFIIKLYNTYQTVSTVYFLLELATNGDLYEHVIAKHARPLRIDCVRFISAEVLMALEYIRSFGFVHRDIKIENVLVDANFHCKLSDFGNAKRIGQPQGNALLAAVMEKNSVFGTRDFVAPEVFYKDDVTFGTDYWTLGFFIFVLYCRTHIAEYLPWLITEDDYFAILDHQKWSYPFDDPDPEIHDLICYLTKIVPNERIGTRDINEIKTHPFFQHLDLDTLQNQVPPGCVETDQDDTGRCEAVDVPPLNLPTLPARSHTPRSAQGPPSTDSSSFGAPSPRGNLRGPGWNTPSSRGSSQGFDNYRGALGHMSPPQNTAQSLGNMYLLQTPPQRHIPPMPTSAPAESRRPRADSREDSREDSTSYQGSADSFVSSRGRLPAQAPPSDVIQSAVALGRRTPSPLPGPPPPASAPTDTWRGPQSPRPTAHVSPLAAGGPPSPYSDTPPHRAALFGPAYDETPSGSVGSSSLSSKGSLEHFNFEPLPDITQSFDDLWARLASPPPESEGATRRLKTD